MTRLLTSILGSFLLATSVLAGVGKVEICIGDGHMELAPGEGHQSNGCCADAPPCTDIVLSAESAPLVRICDQVETQEDAARSDTTTWTDPLVLSPRPVRLIKPRAEHPPPLGLTLTKITVLRL